MVSVPSHEVPRNAGVIRYGAVADGGEWNCGTQPVMGLPLWLFCTQETIEATGPGLHPAHHGNKL